MEKCSKCGHSNPSGFKFCNECGKSSKAPVVAKEFPEILEIHEQADLSRVALGLFGEPELAISVEELRTALNRLPTENQQQNYIRVMQLHLPGVQVRATFESVANDRNVSSTTVRSSFDSATRKLNYYLSFKLRQ
jgi:hypothetical protein